MSNANPYNYNLPVEPEMFFGRHADVAALVSKLTAVPGDSVALIGGRRMGKTSMLEALRRALERSAAESSDLLPLPIALDLSGEGIASVSDFFRTIYEQAQAAFSLALALPSADSGGFSAGSAPAPALRRSLEAWGRTALEQHGRRLRLVLLLDECEEIVEQPWAADLHAGLRALLVGQSTRSLFKVVMAGSHRFLTQVRQRGSPLWNVLVYHMLRDFDEPATRDLLLRPARQLLPDAVVGEIAEQSGGQPFLTQYLAHHLWHRGVEHATVAAVQQLAAAFHHERHDFADWASGLGATGLHVYGVLAANTAPLTERDIQVLLHPPPANLAQALDALCYHGVVMREADEERYRTVGAMFRTWFFTAAPGVPDPAQPIQEQELLEIKQRRLAVLEQQQARHGIASPPHIVLEIEDLQREIASLSHITGSSQT
jgi:hypothetical protein